MRSLRHSFIAAVVLLMFSAPATLFSQKHDSDPYGWILGKEPRPFMEFVYGIDWPRHKNLEAAFPSIGVLEFKAGYTYVDKLDNDLVSSGSGFISGAWFGSDLGGGTGGTSGFSGELGRFGLGYGQGYGYDLDGAVLVPYFVSSGSLTKLTTTRPGTLSQDDIEILDRYEGTYRFGPSAESGIRVNIGSTFSLSAGYEVNVIYPRIVFWEWLGSYAIISGVNGGVTWFSEDLLEASPTLGPIVIFVVRSGLAWGFYQLLREDMNWPFDSETPLTHEAAKFGVSITL